MLALWNAVIELLGVHPRGTSSFEHVVTWTRMSLVTLLTIPHNGWKQRFINRKEDKLQCSHTGTYSCEAMKLHELRRYVKRNLSTIMRGGKMEVLRYDQYFAFIQSIRTCKTIFIL